MTSDDLADPPFPWVYLTVGAGDTVTATFAGLGSVTARFGPGEEGEQ